MTVTLRELRERNLITKAKLAKLWGVLENIIRELITKHEALILILFLFFVNI